MRLINFTSNKTATLIFLKYRFTKLSQNRRIHGTGCEHLARKLTERPLSNIPNSRVLILLITPLRMFSQTADAQIQTHHIISFKLIHILNFYSKNLLNNHKIGLTKNTCSSECSPQRLQNEAGRCAGRLSMCPRFVVSHFTAVSLCTRKRRDVIFNCGTPLRYFSIFF